MATLKVYSREYGEKKIQQKIKFRPMELLLYGLIGTTILLTIVSMLNYKGYIYSLESQQRKNEISISTKQKDNNEQRVEINNLSSYERIKGIAESLGMKTQKDSIKVVR